MRSHSIETAVRDEIEALHRFFVDWFSGNCSNSDEYFRQEFEQRFDQQFLLIPPAGTTLDLKALSQNIYPRYASNPDFSIAIRQVRVQQQWGRQVLATYEEWQRNALASTPSNNGRIASVIFHLGEEITWLHVHETWLPQSIMAAGPYDF